MAKTPAAILYDANSVELAVGDATALPVNTRGLIGVGYDGTNTRFTRVDASGHQYFVSNQLPAALVGGRLTINLGSWFGGTGPTAGQKPMASSIPVAIASDQSAIPVGQGTPPWKVEGTDADGAPPTENPVLVAGQDGTNVQTLKTETDGALRTRDDFIDDRSKVVGVSFGKFGPAAISATTFYMGIDVSNTTDYRHTAGTKIVVVQTVGKAQKSNAGAKWALRLAVVIRIDGTDADLSIMPASSVSLQDTSKLSTDEQINNFWPHVPSLGVTAGELTKVASNTIEYNVAAVNTATLLEDVAGNTVVPAVGDLLIGAELIAGAGTFEFAYGIQYWVE
jgi:hypothetical protein